MGRILRYSSRIMIVTTDRPVRDSLWTKSSSGISCTASSIGSVTSCSTRSGLAPGKTVTICAARMMKPGSSWRGMLR